MLIPQQQVQKAADAIELVHIAPKKNGGATWVGQWNRQ
jgi:hypothetical protein